MFGPRSRIKPGPGQESVWDYPRPPALEQVAQPLRVVFGGRTIAETSAGYRIVETSHPPVYYIPPTDIDKTCLEPAGGASYCEFKGEAQYWSVTAGGRTSRNAAWSYPDPDPAYRAVKDFLAFYPSRVDECWVGGERVQPQQGDFYGGWITANIVGPFKGGPGTFGW